MGVVVVGGAPVWGVLSVHFVILQWWVVGVCSSEAGEREEGKGKRW